MISAQVLTVRAFGAELMKIGSGGSLEISSGGFRTWRTFQALNMVLACVEINQCVGCTDNSSLSHFSAMTRPSWLGRAVRNEHQDAIEQASRRHAP